MKFRGKESMSTLQLWTKIEKWFIPKENYKKMFYKSIKFDKNKVHFITDLSLINQCQFIKFYNSLYSPNTIQNILRHSLKEKCSLLIQRVLIFWGKIMGWLRLMYDPNAFFFLIGEQNFIEIKNRQRPSTRNICMIWMLHFLGST